MRGISINRHDLKGVDIIWQEKGGGGVGRNGLYKEEEEEKGDETSKHARVNYAAISPRKKMQYLVAKVLFLI